MCPLASNKSPCGHPGGLRGPFRHLRPPHLGGLIKKTRERRALSLSLFICLSRILYTQDSVVGLREEKEKEEKEKKKEEVEAGAFVLPAFYLGSACSQACGRSLPAVYEGRKQWPR